MSSNSEVSSDCDYPPSPCNQVCTLDDDHICVGCLRSMDEIVAWASMSAAEQRNVILQLKDRAIAARLGSG